MPKFNTYTEASNLEDDDLLLIRQTSTTKTRKIKKTSMLASDTSAGLIQIATQTEVNTGSDSIKAITPATLQAKINALQEGLQWKTSCKVATIGNITLSGAQTIDGISVVAGDRVLVKNQGTTTQNGIYVAAAGAWSRSVDANTGTELQNATVSADQGTANADTSWRQTTDNVVIGTSPVAFVSFGAAVPDASESTKGKVQLATLQEVIDGAADKAVTSDKAASVYMPKLNASNNDSGIDLVTVNGKSGIGIFSFAIDPGVANIKELTIQNNIIEDGSHIIPVLKYTPAIPGDGIPQIINYYTIAGAITISVINIHPTERTHGPIEIQFQVA